MEEGTDAPGGRGELDVGILEYDEGGVAAQFEMDPLEQRRRQSATARPPDAEPVKAITGTSGWTTRARPMSAAPREHVQHTRGQSGFLEDASQDQPAADSGPRIGLQHHGVAHRQRRSD